jgi:hypothetical protein
MCTYLYVYCARSRSRCRIDIIKRIRCHIKTRTCIRNSFYHFLCMYVPLHSLLIFSYLSHARVRRLCPLGSPTTCAPAPGMKNMSAALRCCSRLRRWNSCSSRRRIGRRRRIARRLLRTTMPGVELARRPVCMPVCMEQPHTRLRSIRIPLVVIPAVCMERVPCLVRARDLDRFRRSGPWWRRSWRTCTSRLPLP